MQDSASSRKHGAIGGSVSGIEQKYASKKLALGLVVSPEESSTSPFIVSEDRPELIPSPFIYMLRRQHV